MNESNTDPETPPNNPAGGEMPEAVEPEAIVLRYARVQRPGWDLSNYAIVLAGVAAALGVLLPPSLAPRGNSTFVCAVVLWGLVALLAGIAGWWAWRRRAPRRRLGMMVASILFFGGGSCFVYSFLREWSSARSERRSIQCAVNLRMIGQALHVYEMNYGVDPPTLSELIDAKLLEPEWTQCLYDERPIADGFDYKYVAGLCAADPPNWIWAYEDPPRHGPDGGGYILYLDSHVEPRWGEKFQQELARFRRDAEAAGRKVVDEGSVLRVMPVEK